PLVLAGASEKEGLIQNARRSRGRINLFLRSNFNRAKYDFSQALSTFFTNWHVVTFSVNQSILFGKEISGDCQ
ncbi:MAG: hypothetical protein QXP36_05050, partial [Conexivisphaerales archaeon]